MLPTPQMCKMWGVPLQQIKIGKELILYLEIRFRINIQAQRE